jgi:hypothetical protein
VAGTDVPLREIEKLTPPDQVWNACMESFIFIILKSGSGMENFYHF